MHTRLITALAASTVLTACSDVGLPDRNLPLEEARTRTPPALVQAVHSETVADSVLNRPVVLGDRIYMVSGRETDVPPGMLQSVGSTGGRAYSALSWDEPPYDRLYTSGLRPGTWRELEIVPAYGPRRVPMEEPAAH